MIGQPRGTAVFAPPLHTVIGVGGRNLRRARGMGDALQSHIKPRVVHHREHRPQPIAFCTHKFGARALKGQLTGG